MCEWYVIPGVFMVGLAAGVGMLILVMSMFGGPEY